MLERRIERVGLLQPQGKNLVEVGECGAGRVSGPKSQPQGDAAMRRHIECHVGGTFGAGVGAHGSRIRVQQIVVDPVLEGSSSIDAEQPAYVGLILAEQPLHALVDCKRQ
jgi:hypothetical protein